MRKSTLIYISVAFLILSLGIFWYCGTGTDVHIAEINASPIGIHESGQLDIVLQNNGSKPVDVWLEVENSFVDAEGVSHSASKLIIPSDLGDSWNEYVSLEKPIHLLPGNNSVSVWIGYYLPGEYPVKVKVVENSRTLDEGVYVVEILPPEIPENLYLKLEYEMESRNTSDVYRIYGYLINKGSGSTENVSTNLTVIDEKTGKLVFTSSEIYGVREYDKTSLWAWPDYPYAVVEIAHGEPSGDSYMPVRNVVVGESEDRFRINVTSTWQNRAVSTELLLPPGEEGR